MNPQVSGQAAVPTACGRRCGIKSRVFGKEGKGEKGRDLSACVRGPVARCAGRWRSERREGRREKTRDRARLPGGNGINPRETQGRARRSEELTSLQEGRERKWKLRDRRRADGGDKRAVAQARLATELLRAATLSLVRRNPVQIYVQLPCQQCLKSLVRACAAFHQHTR